jgi:hypothetical protein
MYCSKNDFPVPPGPVKNTFCFKFTEYTTTKVNDEERGEKEKEKKGSSSCKSFSTFCKED